MMTLAEIVAELRALADRIEAVPEGPEPPAPPALKPILAGLLDRQGEIDRAVKHGLAGVVITAKWSLLQPMPGILDPGDLILDVHDAKMAGLRVRLRVLGGIYAPDWAKNIGGAPFQVSVDDKPGTCGRWWHPDYIAAWRELHRQLAAVFDGDPVIADVDLGGGCGIVAAEPFLRGGKRGPTTLAMVAAGFTADDDYDAHEAMLACLNEWETTRGYLAFNPYQYVTAAGGIDIEEQITVGAIEDYRRAFGSKLVLGNDSIRYPMQAANGYAEMYFALGDAGKPLSFQTANPEKIGDWASTLEWAVDLGASSVELPRSYPQWDAVKLAEFGRALEANAT